MKASVCIVFHSDTFWYFIKEKTFYNLSTTSKSTPGKIEWKIFCFEYPPLFFLLVIYYKQKSERKRNMWPHYIWPSFSVNESLKSSIYMFVIVIPFKSIFFKGFLKLTIFLLQWTFQWEVWQGAICFKLQPPAFVLIFWQADSYTIKFFHRLLIYIFVKY